MLRGDVRHRGRLLVRGRHPLRDALRRSRLLHGESHQHIQKNTKLRHRAKVSGGRRSFCDREGYHKTLSLGCKCSSRREGRCRSSRASLFQERSMDVRYHSKRCVEFLDFTVYQTVHFIFSDTAVCAKADCRRRHIKFRGNHHRRCEQRRKLSNSESV